MNWRSELPTRLDPENVPHAREWVLYWLESPTAYVPRPDLAEALPPGEEVTLTYAQLVEIVLTVRWNAKQR